MLGLQSTNHPTVAIMDFRVYAWKIQDLSPMVKSLVTPEVYKSWIRACWAILCNHGPLPLKHHANYQVIVVDDDSQTKPYWRSQYLSDRGFPRYKGNRPSAKPFGFNEIVQIGLEYVRNPSSALHYICVPGYEADDLAGLACQLVRNCQYLGSRLTSFSGKFEPASLSSGKLKLCESQIDTIRKRKLALCTLDTDWLQLVTENITWYNTSHQEPRIRKPLEVTEYVKRRLGATISSPRDIASVKSTQGDRSDNLLPGSPIEVIDLLSPPREYRLIDTNTGLLMANILGSPRANNRIDHLEKSANWIKSKGLPLPASVST